MGDPDPHLEIQGELDIQLLFQYWCYSKQDPPQNWVNPTPLQVLCHISSISTASGEPLLMAERDMIIIYYFYPLQPSEYTGSK